METTHLRRAAGCLMTIALAACSAAGLGNNDHAGETRECAGEPRVMLDCSSEVSYQGVSGEAGVDVMGIGAVSGKFEDRAIRRVNDQVAQFVAAQTRSCREYNGCVLSGEQYRAEASETRRKLQVIPAALEALKMAKSETERARALDLLYRGVVPDDKRVEEVTFRLGMVAEMPDGLGGGTFAVAPGGAVPTGAKVFFKLDVSKEAYVYMFQTTPRGEVNVLYPDPRIGTQNPVPARLASRIPDRKSFRVNAKDLGTESVYMVVSREPVSDLNAALDKVKSGEVSTLAQSQMLRSVAMVAPPAAAKKCKTRALVMEGGNGGGGDTCTRPRGLELDDEGMKSRGVTIGDVPAGMQVRTHPGDDLIVTVFPFEHLTAQAYKSAGGTKAASHKVRGIIMED
ncbi:MAG: DUF4384 domain-containing protein [Deltaproteobacteria bacterium]|nr:DUF4384 domain-containing protein [Deltaproteobacteria bacterium]